ncbi:MAG TPA: alpha-amylase family glycosyl hydrolase [Acidimicrobiales bacterium]|nr:alpha-amylase family glycosyl hydrolase [Acidimicrobiales bacterium]
MPTDAPPPSTAAGPTGGPTAWWRTGLLYQLYIRSFADADGDGVGDLRGVRDRLDHLSWLGVDGIWLSPVTPSPNADFGYDVADYCAVHPQFGTLDDLDELVAAAGERKMRVLIDLVPNHTSDRHPWFIDARSGRDSAYRDFYVWADPKPDGSPPNNWVGCFGGPAWTLDDTTGQYYLHNFLPEQPDLNWWNEDVRQAFDQILAFWWDRGIAGFRIDVCHMIVKDAALRDNPPATEDDPFIMQIFGQRPLYTSNQPEVHEVLRRWRRRAEGYDPARVLLGETNVEALETLVSYYGNGHDELSLGFNFPFIESAFEADALRGVVEETEALLPDGAWPVWTGSNHDVSRLASRWAGADPARTRLALLMLLTLRGTPVLYQGDEIGLVDGELSREQILDPVGVRFWPAYPGRDPERTPMPWSDAPHGGFTAPGTTPWLPVGDPAKGNVAAQREDRGSVLHFVRDVVALRRRHPDLREGDYRSLPAPAGAWVWRRGAATTVALNLSAEPVDVEVPTDVARVLVGTDRSREGSTVTATVALAPWEGVVLAASP